MQLLAFAETKNWLEIYSAKELTAYFDNGTYTVEKENSQSVINCWIKFSYAEGDSYVHCYIRTTDMQFRVQEFNEYANGKLIRSIDRSSEGWKTPAPNSNMAKLLTNIVSFVQTNTSAQNNK